jgi:hypothetical protein
MADPALVDLRIIQGSHWTKPFRLMVTDPVTLVESLLDTTGYTAAMDVRAAIEDADAQLHCDTTIGTLEVGFDPPKRANLTAYGVGQQVVPTTLNGYVYQCTVAGTSGGSAPAYSTTLNATFTDGTVTWRVQSADTVVSNLRIALAPSDTTPLSNWGNGLYDIQLTDTFGHTERIIEGSAVLSRELTR